MAEPQGWIKLHRQILEHPIFSDPQAFSLWVQLLLRANHKDAKIMVGNSFVQVKRGQLLTGRNKLAEYTNINRSKLERLLNMLESEHQIEQQKTTKYRLISITNYDKYQGDEQQVSIKRATSEQQVSTNKNDNNVNNDKNIKQTAIPYQLIADSYNQNFADQSGNSHIAKLTEARKRLIKKAWKYDTDNDNEKLRTDNLDYWNRYFAHCASIPFFQADCPRSGDHATWNPDIEFIIKEKTQTKVREGGYK